MTEPRTPSTLTTAGGEPLSRIGLGTAGLGVRESQADATIRRAIDLGVNWIDTDAVFGRGEAERRIGRSLAALPAGERPFVMMAVGFDWDGRSPRARLRPTLEPRRLRQQLERSLSRLGIEMADLVKLHLAAPSDALFEDAWSMLLDLRQSGLVRNLGLIAPDSAHLERAERISACDSVHVELSLIDRRAGSDLLWRTPTSAVIACRPLAGGELTGPPTEASGDALQPVRRLLQTIAARRRTTPAAVATAWSLSWPGVAAVAVGARSADEVVAVAKAAEIELSVRDLSDIAKLLPALGGGRGPVHPRRFSDAA
jgi:aryl-alcohol dehydrogenase-like predicted oxidoreductase